MRAQSSYYYLPHCVLIKRRHNMLSGQVAGVQNQCVYVCVCVCVFVSLSPLPPQKILNANDYFDIVSTSWMKLMNSS